MPLPIDNPAQSGFRDDLYDETQVLEEATQSFVTFRLGHQWYGISVHAVREIVRMPRLAYLPSAPFSIAGLANIRGTLLAVIDPKRVLGLPATSPSVQSRVVVFASGESEAGFLADDVSELIAVPISHLEPPLATVKAEHLPYIEHLCKWKDRLISIFRVDQWLAFKAAEPSQDVL